MSTALRDAVARLMSQERLGADETAAAVESIMEGEAPAALPVVLLAIASCGHCLWFPELSLDPVCCEGMRP